MTFRFESKFDKHDLVYMLTPCDSIRGCPYDYPTIIRGIVKGVKCITNCGYDDPKNNRIDFYYDVEITAAYDLYSGNQIDLSNEIYKLNDNLIYVSEKSLMRESDLDSHVKTIERTLKSSKLLSDIKFNF